MAEGCVDLGGWLYTEVVYPLIDDHACQGWLRGTVVERQSLTGELSLSCARPTADG